jgi:cytochrome c peroxidase
MRMVTFCSKGHVWTLLLCASLMAHLVGCARDSTGVTPPPPQDAELRELISRWGVIPILPNATPANPALAELGRSLFFDKILSGNRDVSCATCHSARATFSDRLSLAVGTGGVDIAAHREPGAGRQHVPRNAPTLVNIGLGAFYLFWDGRLTEFGPRVAGPASETVPPGLADVLVAQSMLPVVNRVEMRGETGDRDVFGQPNELATYPDDQPDEVRRAIMRRLLAIPAYVSMFNAAFPGVPTTALTYEHAAKAIAAFETSVLRRTATPFDRYLARDNSALSAGAKRGARMFFGNEGQCVTCHSGPLLGGASFANVGAPQVGPGFGAAKPLDLGRGELFPNIDVYRFSFRAPPLRNVELTAPYMHSGAYPTLEAVVRHYANVPKAIREYDVTQLHPSLRSAYHGDAATIDAVLRTLDFRLRSPLNLTNEEQSDLVAFLKSLTDPSARDLSSVIPAAVPSGLPIER